MREPIEKGKGATTKEEYINAAVSQIENDSDKQEAALELAAHIDDRIEYYKEIGFDEAQAAQKAVEQMGDPDAVAVPLSRLHPKGRVWTAVLAVLLFGLALAVFWLCTLVNSEIGFGIIEFLLLLSYIGFSLFGKRRRNRFLCALPMVIFSLTYPYYALILADVEDPICSSIVLTFFCLITGDFTCLGTFPMVGGITVAPWLTYTTYGFYGFIFLVLVLTFVNTCRMRKPNYSLAVKRRSKILSVLQKSILFFSALNLLIAPFFAQYESGWETLGLEPKHFNAVVILQSDRPCSIEEVDQGDILILEASGEDFGVYINWYCSDADTKRTFDIYGESVKVLCGRKLQYVIGKDIIVPEITKPYVYVGFINTGTGSIHRRNVSDFVTLTEEDWQEAKLVGTRRAAVDQNNLVEVVVNAS